jgi:hypothetical protein
VKKIRVTGLVVTVKLKDVYKSKRPNTVKRETKRKKRKNPKILRDKTETTVVL